MKRFATLALLLAAALPVAAGLTDLDNPGPSVVSVTARQRYPWNGLVDVDVSFEGKSGETYRIELSATDKAGGTNLPVRTAWLEGGESAHGNPVDVPAPGTHRLVWNAAADLPAGFTADRVTVTAKLLNPIWSFDTIPAIDPDDEWAPETVYHDVQTIVSYGEIEDHAPTVRCLTDEWNLETSLGANVVFSGASMGLRNPSDVSELGFCPINLWAYSASTNVYRIVTLDYNTGAVRWDTPLDFGAPDSDVRFFCMRSARYRQFAVLSRSQGPDAFLKSTGGSDAPFRTLGNRYADAEHGSAVCGYFPNGIPVSDASSTSVSSYDKELNSAVFFSGVAGTDMKEAVLKCSSGGSIGIQTTSQYSCMGNAVGRYVVPLLNANKFFTVACPDGYDFIPQNFWWALGSFDRRGSWQLLPNNNPRDIHTARSKAVAMPDGERVFLGGVGKWQNGSVRMWNGTDDTTRFCDFPSGHPFESWARRDVTCLLPNGKFCGVDEDLGLVVVNPLTGETYVASDDPVFKKGKMGCQLLPNGKVWIIPYDCEGREYLAGTNLCGKLYEVDFGFTRSFSLSSLCSPYLKVAEGDPEPSGIKVGLDPNGGELPGIYAQYYKGANPVYGELPVPTWTGYTFLGWSTDGSEANIVAATDSVPAQGGKLKAAWAMTVYTVSFNANGGTGTMSDQTMTRNVSATLRLNAFTRSGHMFMGWATNAIGTKVYDDAQSVSNLTTESSITLYALWEALTAQNALYMVVDLSGGANASSYPISYLSAMPNGGWTDTHKKTKLVLRRIEPGSFKMGGSANVTLTKPFYIGIFEVTQKQYQLVDGSNPCSSGTAGKGDTYPVYYVSYDMVRGSSDGSKWPSSNAVDSSSFMGKFRSRTGLAFDLPTEAQWEYACRAGTTTTYSYGNSVSGNYMWFNSNSDNDSHIVGSKLPNAWGLYDMHGNVWEWGLDWYASSLGGGTDPKGPSSGSIRAKRGGSWASVASCCDSSYRHTLSYPSTGDNQSGFRICVTMK